MLSLKKLKEIDPINTEHLIDVDLEAVRNNLYDLAQLMFDVWYEEKFGSKNPLGLLVNNGDNNKIGLCKKMKKRQE
ncbi:MAG: hypothetical protein WA051_02150 [Minisyncoccia bacterium]